MALANSKANAGLKFSASWNPDKADDLLAGSGHTFAEILDAANHQKPLPHFALQSSISAVVLTSRKPVHSKNVIGLRPGTDPKLKNYMW